MSERRIGLRDRRAVAEKVLTEPIFDKHGREIGHRLTDRRRPLVPDRRKAVAPAGMPRVPTHVDAVLLRGRYRLSLWPGLADEVDRTIGTLLETVAALRSRVAERDRKIEWLSSEWAEARHQRADLQRRLTEAEEALANTQRTVIDGILGSACEQHENEIRGESAADFIAKEAARGCPRCLGARLTEAEARAEKAVGVATAMAGIVVGNAVRKALAATPASPPADHPTEGE